jgi:large subunit ribosomal protein L29
MSDFKELKNKNIAELNAQLTENRELLRELRFKDSNRQLKNVRQVRSIKKTIAKILTVLNQKKHENDK